MLLLLPFASAILAGACTGTVAAPSNVGASVSAIQISHEPWPGKNAVVNGDNLNQFGHDLSGLFYEPAHDSASAVLWAALNRPGKVYRLVPKGDKWSFDTANDWGAGKVLRYPNNTGDPDTESVTRAELNTPFFYTSTERNNDADSVNRLSILRFDSSTPGTTLTATHEWDLTADLPPVKANKGPEAITWIPDTYLVSKGFLDESRGGTYDPGNYPNHGTGLFVVGVEDTGIYAYALDHAAGSFQKIAVIPTGHPSGHPNVMGLEFDRDTGALWSACDNSCDGAQNVLGVVGGKFVVRRIFDRPSTLPNSNNEGIAIAPESECSGGFKRFFWSDDDAFEGYALRFDLIPCGPLF